MNRHGSFVVASLILAMIATLCGVAVSSASKLRPGNHYIPKFEALQEEREELCKQLDAITKIKIKEVTVTAYSSTMEECGEDPKVTASMAKVRPGIVAVSRDLFNQGWVFGKKVYVKDHGVFEIADLMSKRYSKRMDIYFPATEDARKFGVKQQVTVALLAG